MIYFWSATSGDGHVANGTSECEDPLKSFSEFCDFESDITDNLESSYPGYDKWVVTALNRL